MAQRHVTEAIHNPLRRKNAAGCGQIRNERGSDQSTRFIRHAG